MNHVGRLSVFRGGVGGVWVRVDAMIFSKNSALLRSSALFKAVIWREACPWRPSGSVTVSEISYVPDVSNL